jgi:rhodanese-related sulfurtransferase
MASGEPGFVLLDVRGRDAFEKAHVPGAISLPHREIDEAALSRWPRDILFVVYCAGPHCNGGDKGAVALSRLGRSVKLMIGGVAG